VAEDDGVFSRVPAWHACCGVAVEFFDEGVEVVRLGCGDFVGAWDAFLGDCGGESGA
jgi:hypothetical protein